MEVQWRRQITLTEINIKKQTKRIKTITPDILGSLTYKFLCIFFFYKKFTQNTTGQVSVKWKFQDLHMLEDFNKLTLFEGGGIRD